MIAFASSSQCTGKCNQRTLARKEKRDPRRKKLKPSLFPVSMILSLKNQEKIRIQNTIHHSFRIKDKHREVTVFLYTHMHNLEGIQENNFI
jgi:hypothetical protein